MKLPLVLPLAVLSWASLSLTVPHGDRIAFRGAAPSFAAPGVQSPARPAPQIPSSRVKPPGTSQTSGKRSPLVVVLPKLPSDRGLPGNRAAAASRNCVPHFDQFTVLVPEYGSKSANRQVWGLTQEAKPTLWVHLPWAKSEIASLTLVLVSNRGATLRELEVPLPTQPGVFPVVLDHPLAVGDRYEWEISVMMRPKPLCASPELIYRSGWVERQGPSGASASGASASGASASGASASGVSASGASASVSSPTPPTPPKTVAANLARTYAQRGVWYDAVTALAQARLAAPGDRALQQDWVELLDAVGLKSYAQQPLRPLAGLKR